MDMESNLPDEDFVEERPLIIRSQFQGPGEVTKKRKLEKDRDVESSVGIEEIESSDEEKDKDDLSEDKENDKDDLSEDKEQDKDVLLSEENLPSNLFILDGQIYDDTEFTRLVFWTPELDRVLIDTLYDDFVSKGKPRPYIVPYLTRVKVRTNIMKCKMFNTTELISERIDELKEIVEIVRLFTQRPGFTWSEESKTIIADHSRWEELFEEGSPYLFVWQCTLPYYGGRFFEMFFS